MEDHQLYTNQSSADDVGKIEIKATCEERERLRALASRYSEIAQSDDMKVKKRQWTALRDLKPERPMILFETFCIGGFLDQSEIKCVNPILRNVEQNFLYALKQYEFVKDDIVFENYYRLAWCIKKSNMGVDIVENHAEDSMAYLSNFPIKTPDDIAKLKFREYYVDRERTLGLKNTLEEIFGDILPVRVGNFDQFFGDLGFNPFVGNNAPLITMDLFKLMGNDNLLFWPYDYPDELKAVVDFLLEDRLRFLKWAQEEKIFALNTDNQFAGPSGYGYVSELPAADSKEMAVPSNMWTWVESQESAPFSPEMFDEWFLPALAEYSNKFGLVSYGCCERLDDRIEYILKAIPKTRTVSVSGWSNYEKMASILGKDHVYCRKPTPAYISGAESNWNGMRKDIEDTWRFTKDQPVEFIVRDVYDVGGDIDRIPKWVDMVKEITGIK